MELKKKKIKPGYYDIIHLRGIASSLSFRIRLGE